MAIQVPDKKKLSAVQALCEQQDPYKLTPGVNDLFVEAMQQNIRWHMEKCDFYARLVESKNFSPDMLSVPRLPKSIPVAEVATSCTVWVPGLAGYV